MPDGCVDVFVTAQGDVMIAGPANTFYDLPTGDQDILAGLRLRPGAAAAVIGCPANEFRDMRVPLDSAFGVAGSRIAESLLGATTPAQRMSAGYADQSHMINECLALTGGPPTALPVSVLSNTLAEPSS
jgi:hypothetical protein